MSSLYTDPAQHPIAAHTGSTVHDVDDLYDLSDLDRDLSELWTKSAVKFFPGGGVRCLASYQVYGRLTEVLEEVADTELKA